MPLQIFHISINFFQIFDGYDDTAIENKFCSYSTDAFYSSSNVAFIKGKFTKRFMSKFLLDWEDVPRPNAAMKSTKGEFNPFHTQL